MTNEFSPDGDFYRLDRFSPWLSSEAWGNGWRDAIDYLTDTPSVLGGLETDYTEPTEVLENHGMLYEGDDGYIDGFYDCLVAVYEMTVDGVAIAKQCHREAQRRMVASLGKESK